MESKSYVELNDEELDRKVMEDLANFEYDENEDSSQFDGGEGNNYDGLSGAVFDRGSIFFDDYIKRQNERMQRDQEDFEKENELYKQFLSKNNAGGQELFDEIDKDLANLRKMTKVKVKPDPIKPKPKPVVPASSVDSVNATPLQDRMSHNELSHSMMSSRSNRSRMHAGNNNNCSENEESFIEIEDGFGETTKYRPDVITQSQYLAIKEKAREEARMQAEQMVFAEDKIKKQFIIDQGLLSDEDSIMSGELFEEDNDDEDDDFLNHKMPAGNGASHHPKKRPLSRVDSLEDIKNLRPSKLTTLQPITDTPVRKAKKKFTTSNNLNTLSTSNMKNSMRSSQIKYEQVMSGQKLLKSSVTASVVFKQQLDAKLDAKQDRMTQERELFAMDNEDFLSMEYEDLLQRKAFALKDYKLPKEFPIYLEAGSPATALHLQFDDPHIGQIQFDAPLSLNNDNLLTRDSLEMCLQDLSKRKKRTTARKRPVQPQQPNKSNSKPNPSKQNELATGSTPPSKFIDIAPKESTHQQSTITSPIQNRLKIEAVEPASKKTQPNSVPTTIATSLAEIYRSRLENGRARVLFHYLNSGLLQEIECISSAYEPKLIGQFVDQANENIILDEFDSVSSSNEHATSNNNPSNSSAANNPRQLKQVLSSDIFGTFQKKRRLEIKLENICDLSGIDNLPNLELVNLSVNRISDMSALLELKSQSRIVELSLAQNNISDYSSIRGLVQLRSLNLELNRIETMSDLSACVHLEHLNLNSNRLNAISKSIQSNKQLRRFSAFKNQLSGAIGNAFSRNVFLEELDISRNRITCIAGLQTQNLLLKKLVASHNQITELPADFAFIFLVEAWLNNNQIHDLSGLGFLPCLQYLNVASNHIDRIAAVPLLPNLSTLLINFNRITHFESLFNLVRASPNLKYLSFNPNPFVAQQSAGSNQSTTDDLKDLYDYLLIRHLPRITELNHVLIDVGRTRYLERRFSSLVKSKPQLDEDTIQSFLSEFNLITRQHQFVHMQKKSRTDCLFAQTLAFQILDSTFTMLHVKRMLVEKQAHKTNGNPQTKTEGRTKNSSENTTQTLSCLTANGIFFRRDFFENKVKKSVHKIKTLALQALHRIRARKAIYMRNTHRIIQLQSWFRGCLIRKLVNFASIFAKRRANSAASKIQSAFRRFKLLKKKRKLMNKIKYEDDEDLPEFDDAWLKQPIDEYDTGLEIPAGFDVMSFINAPAPPTPKPHIHHQHHSQPIPHNFKLTNNNFLSPHNSHISSNTLSAPTAPQANPTQKPPIPGSTQISQTILPQENSQNGKKQHIVQNSMPTMKNLANHTSGAHTASKTAQSPLPKGNLLPPIQQQQQQIRGNHNAGTNQSMGALQNNNFMRNQASLSNQQQQMPNANGINAGNYLNTQKARLHSQRSSDHQAQSETNSVASRKEDSNSLGNSGFSYQSEHVRKPAMSMASSNASSQIFPQMKSTSSSKPSLAPVKSVKVTEEEKQKIMDEWGFTKPEVVQTFAYRLEKSRRNKVKSLPLTAEQRYDKFLQSSKSQKK